MASEQHLSQLRTTAERFKAIERDKLLRSTLGEESLESSFGPRLEEIKNKLDFAIEFAPSVHDTYVSQVTGIFSNILQQLEAQTGRSNAEYVSQKDSFINAVTSQLQNLQQYWSNFVTAAIEARGFLKDEGIRKEYQKTIESIKEESTSALKLVKEEADKTIEEARQLAKQIEERARKTAAHISVGAAQEQFRLAQQELKTQIKIWSVLSALSVVAFILTAIYLSGIQFPEQWTWRIIYHTAIRITILTAIGAIATFCLKILRAYLHMRQHNLHRQRIANSMAAFVESAVTPEQRDLILTHLVDAVAAFGSSGLLSKEDDSINTSKMTIDNITRMFTPPSTKPPS